MCGIRQPPSLPYGIITTRRAGMKEIEDDHLRKHEKYFWVFDPGRGSATSNKPGFTLDEGKVKIFRKQLLSLRRDLVPKKTRRNRWADITKASLFSRSICCVGIDTFLNQWLSGEF